MVVNSQLSHLLMKMAAFIFGSIKEETYKCKVCSSFEEKKKKRYVTVVLVLIFHFYNIRWDLHVRNFQFLSSFIIFSIISDVYVSFFICPYFELCKVMLLLFFLLAIVILYLEEVKNRLR